jgi:formylmethanofuran dehydrogenase subunit B
MIMKTCEKHPGCLVISYGETCPICGTAFDDLCKKLGESFELFKVASALGAKRIEKMEAEECQKSQSYIQFYFVPI